MGFLSWGSGPFCCGSPPPGGVHLRANVSDRTPIYYWSRQFTYAMTRFIYILIRVYLNDSETIADRQCPVINGDFFYAICINCETSGCYYYSYVHYVPYFAWLYEGFCLCYPTDSWFIKLGDLFLNTEFGLSCCIHTYILGTFIYLYSKDFCIPDIVLSYKSLSVYLTYENIFCMKSCAEVNLFTFQISIFLLFRIQVNVQTGYNVQVLLEPLVFYSLSFMYVSVVWYNIDGNNNLKPAS